MEYIAHIRQKDGKIQTVKEHSQEVQQGSEYRGEKIGVRHLAGLAGLLHDLGKNTNKFKTYIQEAVANPDAPPRRGSVDHSTAGGKLIYSRYHLEKSLVEDKLASEWIANCIISHHQGLRDFLDPQLTSPVHERLTLKNIDEFEQSKAEFFKYVPEKELDQYFSKAKSELKHILDVIQKNSLPPIASSLLIKFIFSCIIDADRTNTREFEEDEKPEPPLDRPAFFHRSYEALMNKLREMDQADDADHSINRLRRDMSLQCDLFAQRPSGIYSLSIPTGGGKTLASLRYALKHATIYNKHRIIYIVPYTTIIEQNAAEIREILQENDMILEHHSNVIEESDSESEHYDVRKKKIRLARDNWDRPVIFTTMVQFLNTIYAKGTRNVRRMHQLSNAVIIFDEVQSVPIKCISLFNAAVNFLHILGHSSVLLCTATQPTLDYVKNKLHISKDAEMIENLDEVGESFKRVNICDLTTTLGWDAEQLKTFVQERMNEVNSVLVILNTKTAVRKLFDRLTCEEWLKENGVSVIHLSTNMCAAHRKDKLSKLKQALELRERVICVSTQLIEAGVNISFECVIRSLAGLDSIAQAAGRCNRHGKDEIRNVYIVKSADESLSKLPEIKIGAEQTQRLLGEFKNEPERYDYDLLSASAMKAYFEYYFYYIKDEMHYRVPKLDKNLFDLLSHNKAYFEGYKNKHGKSPEILCRTSFATAEQYFEAISSSAKSVLVPYNDEAMSLILALNGELHAGELGVLLQKLQQYVVNMYDYELKKLEKNGDLYHLMNGHVMALRETAYSEQFGAEANGEGEWQTVMI